MSFLSSAFVRRRSWVAGAACAVAAGTMLGGLAAAAGCAAAPEAGGVSEPKCPAPPVAAASSPPSARSAASKENPAPLATTVDTVEAEIVKRINAKDGKGLVALFGAGMREALPEDKAGPFVAGVIAAKGLIESSARVPGQGGEHHGVYRLEAERGAWQVVLDVAKDGKVLGMKLTEPPAAEPAVVKSTIPLVLPFRGQWSVFWGGDNLDVNQHVSHKSQRRAADLIVLGPDGKSHRGEGQKNEDYFAYGQDVVAVADGTVATVIDGIGDNVPGAMNGYMALGNAVIIKHSDALYSLYAHLQPGKLRVKVGAKVKAGTLLGLCGNSGNSSEAHLHFQLQDGPLMENSWGVEPVFKAPSVVRDGKAVKLADYTFSKGDLVGEPPRR